MKNNHRIVFQIGKEIFKFRINPSEMKETSPQRVAYLKTKSRIVVQDFQTDIGTISISGTHGYKPDSKKGNTGFQKLKTMKKMLQKYQDAGGHGLTPSEEFTFYNLTNGGNYIVHIPSDGFEISQSANSPLLYEYSIELIILRKAGEPKDDEILEAIIGTDRPSISDNPIRDAVTGGGNSLKDAIGSMPTGSGNSSNSNKRPNTGGGTTGGIKKPTTGGNAFDNIIDTQTQNKKAVELGKQSMGHSLGFYGNRY